jgi:hypothetical protein
MVRTRLLLAIQLLFLILPSEGPCRRRCPPPNILPRSAPRFTTASHSITQRHLAHCIRVFTLLTRLSRRRGQQRRIAGQRCRRAAEHLLSERWQGVSFICFCFSQLISGCFSYLRDMGILSRIVPLLQHSNVKLLTRAVGVRRPPAALGTRLARVWQLITRALLQVVHNMSSDSSSIASIRHEQALPMLIHLLKVAHHSQSHKPCSSSMSTALSFVTRQAGPTARHLR